jgi:hypothetical protein
MNEQIQPVIEQSTQARYLCGSTGVAEKKLWDVAGHDLSNLCFARAIEEVGASAGGSPDCLSMSFFSIQLLLVLTTKFLSMP